MVKYFPPSFPIPSDQLKRIRKGAVIRKMVIRCDISPQTQGGAESKLCEVSKSCDV